LFRIFSVLFLTIFFAGCIQEDIRIVLRADGSGEYHIKKVTSQIESAVLANIPAEERDKELAKQQEVPKEYAGGLKLISANITPSPDDPSKFITTSVYSFSNLGEALPDLENLIEMGPRYAYRNDRFVIFRDREKEKWDGIGTDEMNNAFLNLTIELPAEPLSSNGKVTEKTVKWKFNADDLKKYQQMPIGDNLIEASIPASAIKVDLTPRLVEEQRKSTEKEEADFESLDFFTARFPVIGEAATNQPVHATLQVVFPTNGLDLPVSYKDLQIASLIIGGKEVKAELKTEPMGVFDGKDQWGRATRGFPVSLEFPVSDPWMNKIDALQIQMNVNAVEKSQQSVFDVSSDLFPGFILPKEPNMRLDKVVISRIETGSSSAIMPNQSITLLTTTEPSAIRALYLDTDYGLRYKASGIKSTLKDKNDFWDESVKKFVIDFFKEEKVYEYEIGFVKIPKPPFKLIIETIDKADFQPKMLTLEDIDVSP